MPAHAVALGAIGVPLQCARSCQPCRGTPKPYSHTAIDISYIDIVEVRKTNHICFIQMFILN